MRIERGALELFFQLAEIAAAEEITGEVDVCDNAALDIHVDGDQTAYVLIFRSAGFSEGRADRTPDRPFRGGPVLCISRV